MSTIKEIQAKLKFNFDTYANNRVFLLEELEQSYGNMFVHFGTNGQYEDWYYFVKDGCIFFGFSSVGVFMNAPPEAHICLLPIMECDIDSFEEAYDQAREVAKNKWNETTHKWIKDLIKSKRNELSTGIMHH